VIELGYTWSQLISVYNDKLLKSESICQSYPQMKKGPVFLTHSVEDMFTDADHANSSSVIRPVLSTERDRLKLLITLIICCINNTCGFRGMMRKAFYYSGIIIVF